MFEGPFRPYEDTATQVSTLYTEVVLEVLLKKVRFVVFPEQHALKLLQTGPKMSQKVLNQYSEFNIFTFIETEQTIPFLSSVKFPLSRMTL